MNEMLGIEPSERRIRPRHGGLLIRRFGYGIEVTLQGRIALAICRQGLRIALLDHGRQVLVLDQAAGGREFRLAVGVETLEPALPIPQCRTTGATLLIG